MTNSVVVVAHLIIALCLLVKPVTGHYGVTATVSANYTALANLIVRPDVTGLKINGVEFKGSPQQIGSYATMGPLFSGLPRSGVVMSSGRVVNVQEEGIESSGFFSPGDDDLTYELRKIGLTGFDAGTYDAAVLVVDVSVQKAVDIDIAFVFGSNEYLGFDLSKQYADVFGLFHEGTNIALIGNDPVSVKTVNCGANPPKNCNQFINANLLETSLAGYTMTRIVTLKLPVGTNQKVKIAIADAHDDSLDAAVFLSFQTSRPALT
jgi:hypothetical protein